LCQINSSSTVAPAPTTPQCSFATNIIIAIIIIIIIAIIIIIIAIIIIIKRERASEGIALRVADEPRRQPPHTRSCSICKQQVNYAQTASELRCDSAALSFEANTFHIFVNIAKWSSDFAA